LSIALVLATLYVGLLGANVNATGLFAMVGPKKCSADDKGRTLTCADSEN